MQPSRSVTAALFSLLVSTACTTATGAPAGMQGPLHEPADWARDAAWYDGQAEMAVYAARRTIYGVPRSFEAVAYTNKQRMDPVTTTKASGERFLEAFKHHWSERVPTERYDYDFSTATFLDTTDLSLFKLTAATQEDCGASFKQVWREGSGLGWMESVYFPDAGLRDGRLDGPAVSEDGLALQLRNLVAGAREGTRFPLRLLASQKSTRRVSFEPVDAEVVVAGSEERAVPAGTFACLRLELRVGGTLRSTYWFAQEGGAPLLHVLVAYEGPDGQSYALSRHERTAYWAR